MQLLGQNETERKYLLIFSLSRFPYYIEKQAFFSEIYWFQAKKILYFFHFFRLTFQNFAFIMIIHGGYI